MEAASKAELNTLKGRVSQNEIDIKTHDVILVGKEDEFRDQGLVGVMTNIEKHLKDRKDAEDKRDARNFKVGLAVGGSLAVAAILGAAGSVWRVYLESLLMQQ